MTSYLSISIGVGELAISDHRSSQPTLDEFLRIASDAHAAGMITQKAGILHLHLGDGARGLQLIQQALLEAELPARVYHPTHINRQKALLRKHKASQNKGSRLMSPPSRMLTKVFWHTKPLNFGWPLMPLMTN